MTRSARPTSSRILSVLLAVLCLGACGHGERTERWIGYYQFPDNDIRFPIFMEFTVSGETVTGRSADPRDVASIEGTFVGDQYELLLHPLRMGTSTDQDIHFRGRRSEDVVVGEWEHVVGVRGPWRAEITELDEKDALDLYRVPCNTTAAVKEDRGSPCANGA